MYNQFDDDKLSGRIKEVFENFEDDSADFGWAELRKRFPGEEKRKHVAMWWWSSAAAILLVTIAGLTFYRTSEKNYLTGKPAPKMEEKIAIKPNLRKIEETEVQQEGILHEKNELPSQKPMVAGSRAVDQVAVSQTQIVKNAVQALQGGASISENGELLRDDIRAIVIKEEQRVSVAQADEKFKKQPVITESSEDKLENAIATEMLQSKSSFAIALATIPENPKVQEKKDKNLSFAVFAGSYVNYANGSQSGVNTGVGISSEIRLSKKLKISTGVSIAQNTLKYENDIPLAAAADFRSNVALDEAQLDLGNQKIIAPALPASYSLNNYNASLGLDIPINLKYTLFHNKNELYVVAGVSSNFFLEETYSYSYELSRGSGNSFMTKDDEFASAKAENFDFARMVNLSVGFGHPVGKQSRLSFEPFVKYPLGGQGARDLRFGAAGMNVKLNFSRLKL